MKRFLTVLLISAAVCSFARMPGAEMRPGKRPLPPQKHPLCTLLDSKMFTPEERTRLKTLAEKDKKAFAIEMRKHFMKQRKAEAEKILNLRKQILEAKDPAVKKKIEEELKVLLRKKADQRLAFHKKILDETVRNIEYMQKRCETLRNEYKKRKNNKEQLVEEELKKILSSEPPAHLQKFASWDPEKPFPPPPGKKRIRK